MKNQSKFQPGSEVLVRPSRAKVLGLHVDQPYKVLSLRPSPLSAGDYLVTILKTIKSQTVVNLEDCIIYVKPDVVKRKPIDRDEALYRIRRDMHLWWGWKPVDEKIRAQARTEAAAIATELEAGLKAGFYVTDHAHHLHNETKVWINPPSGLIVIAGDDISLCKELAFRIERNMSKAVDVLPTGFPTWISADEVINRVDAARMWTHILVIGNARCRSEFNLTMKIKQHSNLFIEQRGKNKFVVVKDRSGQPDPALCFTIDQVIVCET